MNVKEWLDKVAYVKECDLDGVDDVPDAYYSKFDDSYITFIGLEDDMKFLADREITGELTHGVGFSPKDEKWYGWSHRAIYGFEIGSTCNEGDCHYIASTPEYLIDDHAEFFSDFGDESVKKRRAECQILPDRSGIRILHSPVVLPVASMDNLVASLEDSSDLEKVDICKESFHVIKCGRGRWTAKTIEDAKQMAVDFNEGVS